MKTKEFIKRVKELGFVTGRYFDNHISVFDSEGIIVSINEDRPYGTITDIRHLKSLTKELFDLCVEYAKTPIEEREYVKKYHLYLKRTKPKFFDDVGSYLTFNTYTNTFSLDVGVETAHLTAQFTQKEIDEIKERFNTDLEEFEQIEVEE